MERELHTIETLLLDSDLTPALESLQHLLNKHKTNNRILNLILTRLYSLGQSLIQRKSFPLIFPLFQILQKLCQLLLDYSRLCDIKNSLSFCYRNSGQVNLALKESLEAIEIANEHKPLSLKLPALHLNACAIYREDLKDLTSAKTHAELAHFFAKENCGESDKDKRTLAVTCYNHAVVLEELRDKVNALVWYREGLRFCEERWEDVYMEQVFREKVNSLSCTDKMKKTVLSKKRVVSYRPVERYSRGMESRESRPMTYRNQTANKYVLTPINNKTLPIQSVSLGRRTLYRDSEFKVVKTGRGNGIQDFNGMRQKGLRENGKERPKLSLVQSVIKIQKWYRKLFGREKVFWRLKYLAKAVRVYFGVRYYIAICQEVFRNKGQNFEYLIEAWPLTRQIKKPTPLLSTLQDLSELVNSHPTESALIQKSFHLTRSVQITQGKIHLIKLFPIFERDYHISNKPYSLLILYHQRNLEIQATSFHTQLSCTVKLDPLHDESDIKSKLPLILENLKIDSGQLIFNLM